MVLYNFRKIATLATGVLLALAVNSCVTVDKSLGEDYIATNQQYDVYTASFPIEDLRMEQADSLSSYSLYRFSFGSIRDELFGLTTRMTSFTLVPVSDSLDFGIPGTQKFRQFHFAAVSDSVSTDNPSQAHILQNVNVYELESPLDLTTTAPKLHYTKKRITSGVPVYNGTDTLSFNFSKEFGEKYMTITNNDLDTIANYRKRFPGIVITTDEPIGIGGRINMFRLPINVYGGSIYGSYAQLKFTAEYKGRGQVDTSFLFYLGPLQIYDLTRSDATTVNQYPQIAYDQTTHESSSLVGQAGEIAFFEGGRGIKPVVKARRLREQLLEEVSRHGDHTTVIVNKATLSMPFEFPEDYEMISQWPQTMSPTCRIVGTDDEGKETITFAGISDASISNENQGEINRSTCRYSPDISHHAQEIIRLETLDKIDNYDIWFLPLHDEVITESTQTSTSNDMAELYQQLAYSSYYNSMYGGYGYGGYGGGYGSYYNSYYNYMMMAQMYSSMNTGSSTTTQTLMDMCRFYKAKLNGPEAPGEKPTITITYSLPASK